MTLMTNIQKYSVHDGDGIRTTLFFKGCPLRCKWCHNPETLSLNKEMAYNYEACNKCGLCVKACKKNCITIIDKEIKNDYNLCDMCGDCVKVCDKNARNIFGTKYSIKEILKEVDKDMIFYETSGGGITLSGGEVFFQDMKYVKELIKGLKSRGYNILIDTSGYTNYENIKMIMDMVDGFLYDIKIIDEKSHEKYTGKSNKLILENLKKLSNDGGKIHIRIPVIGGVNADRENMEDIANHLEEEKINVERITLSPYHDTAESKYMWLGKESFLKEFHVPTEESIEEYKEIFKSRNFKI